MLRILKAIPNIVIRGITSQKFASSNLGIRFKASSVKRMDSVQGGSLMNLSHSLSGRVISEMHSTCPLVHIVEEITYLEYLAA